MLGHNTRLEQDFKIKPLVGAIILATASLGSSFVQAATYNVLNTNDSGADSLRAVIATANANAGADIILFDPSLIGSTITLTGTDIAITEALTISGPVVGDASSITINGNANSRIFSHTVGDLTLENMTLTNGSAGKGGAVYSISATTTLNDMLVTGNSASDDGGGIRAETLNINRSTISNNNTNGGGEGGGIYAGRDIIIHESTISGNTADGDGGGVYADDALFMYDSTVSGNTSNNDGGGIYTDRDSEIYRSTISGNTTGSDGGGIYIDDDNLLVVQSTITGNTAGDEGGGLYNEGDVDLVNTILSGNTAAFDTNAYIDSTLTSTNSLLGADIFIVATGNVSSDNPLLGPLQDNGGPTFTHLPLAGSPALDVGATTADTVDQRGTGFPRVYNGTVDIGAVERQGVNPLQGGQVAPVPIFSLPGLFAMIAGFLALSRRRKWMFKLK